MPRIHLLPDLLINQIAAGEVVDRPASALKELLENSVDAGATEIEVKPTQGGIKTIHVNDTEGGALSAPQPAAHAVGTTIEARDLYFNTPARRKFLKTEATEYAHCEEMFKRIALAHPEGGFTLQHNGRVTWHLRPTQLAQRVHEILGED